jgi:sugar transferase (PEP-CTERM system associated)
MVLRVFRHYVPTSIICLAVVDLALVSFALQLLFSRELYSSGVVVGAPQSASLQLSALIAVGAVLSGLYDSKSFLTYRALVAQIIFSLVISIGVILFAVYFATPQIPRDWLWEVQKAVLIWLTCIVFTRAVFMTLADVEALKRRVLILGSGKSASRIMDLAADRRNLGFVALKFKEAGRGEVTVHSESSYAGIVGQALACGANEIVVATDERRGLPMDELLQCRRHGIKVTSYIDFVERETNTIDSSALQPGWLVFADGFRVSAWAKFCKRCSDLVLSVLILAATLPLMLLTAFLIAVDSPGPILYRQERVGLAGRKFVLLKFRSMREDAEKDGLARWAARGDARVTRVGRIIRKLRIDELPQLINVLRGDMSLVGPRPERPAFVDELARQLPFYSERHWVKPGITGWAQVKYEYGASIEDARVKLSYDLYYVKNHGLFLDLIIALQTVRVILWADGAR